MPDRYVLTVGAVLVTGATTEGAEPEIVEARPINGEAIIAKDGTAIVTGDWECLDYDEDADRYTISLYASEDMIGTPQYEVGTASEIWQIFMPDRDANLADLVTGQAPIIPPNGGVEPTLGNVTAALGLDPVAKANRGKLIKRKQDETGYEYTDDGGGGGTGPSPSTALPLVEGTASAGTSAAYSRGDHVHPKRVIVDADIPSSIARDTELPQPGTATPLVEGTAAVGTGTRYSREDHVHPKRVLVDADIPSSIARDTELPPTDRLIPSGGKANQHLAKSSATDYATQWVDPPRPGEGGLTSVAPTDLDGIASTAPADRGKHVAISATNEDEFALVAAAKGPKGDPGPRGLPGTSWLTASGAPTDVDGAEAGDFYLDEATGNVYVLQAVGPPQDWQLHGSIKGPKGDKGDKGDKGTKGDKGDKGDPGPKGNPGNAGMRGSRWFTGTAVPSFTQGALADDYYLQAVTGRVYRFNGSSWVYVSIILKGDAGARGSEWETQSGTPPTIQSGDRVGDQSLDVATGDVYSVVLSSGRLAWAKTGNIRGPKGDAGPAGGTGPVAYKTLHKLSVTSASQTFTVDMADIPETAVIDVSFNNEKSNTGNLQRSEAYPLSVPDLKAGRRWILGGVAGAFVQLTLNAAGTSLAVVLNSISVTNQRPLVITLSEIIGALGPPGPQGSAGAGAGTATLLKTVTQTPTGSDEEELFGEVVFTVPKVAQHEAFDIYLLLTPNAVFTTGNILVGISPNFGDVVPLGSPHAESFRPNTPKFHALRSYFRVDAAGDTIFNLAMLARNISPALTSLTIEFYSIRDAAGTFDQYPAITAPKADTDIFPIESAGEVISKISAGNLRTYMQAGAQGPIHAGPGIEVTESDSVGIAPPPYVGGFWGNGSFGQADVEVLRGRDLVMRDERSTAAVDLYWSNGWSIGIDQSGRGIQMYNDQEHNLGPVDGLHPSLENPIYPDVGKQPAGEGRFGFRDGALVWSGGNWPTNGIDMTVEVTFSDFASDSYINLTAETSNNELWGSARVPDRGTRFNGAGGTVKHSHRYELRPTGNTLSTGTTVQLHIEAILHGNPSNNNPVGRFRSAQVTFHYNPASPPVSAQEYDFGLPAQPSTDDPPVGSGANMIPLLLGSHTDDQDDNHVNVLGSIFGFSRDLRNVLCELISQNATTQPAWQLEVWTRLPGVLDWHKQRTIDMPGAKAHSSTNPAYHFYYDLGPVLDGQEFAHVARGLTGTPTVVGMGSGLLSLNTNTDTRFPAEKVLARGLITSEDVAGPENAISSTARAWNKPAANVERWLKFQLLCADNNGNQHAYSFDISAFRFGDPAKLMSVGLSDPTALDAKMVFNRNADGTLGLSTATQIRVITAYLELEA